MFESFDMQLKRVVFFFFYIVQIIQSVNLDLQTFFFNSQTNQRKGFLSLSISTNCVKT